MEFKPVLIVLLIAAGVAAAGCSAPAATPTPTATPNATAVPTPEAAAVPSETPTPAPVATPTPTPTPWPVYSNNSPVSVSNIKITWDTTGFEGQAHETATMTLNNVNKDNLVLDIVLLYKVTTPTTVIDADGTVHNLTNTITKPQNIGVMQWEDRKDVSFDVYHNKNVPATVTIVAQWRGGQATLFEKTLNMADNSFGTYEF
ncbi:MAG TPA: hypothetical protein VMC84_03335 [Methanocella sp.]|nr:hypothetical protein [Methanocella sp.]